MKTQKEEIKDLDHLESTNTGINFSYEQIQAIQKLIQFSLSNPGKDKNQDNSMICLSGSAGTGKSTVISQIIHHFNNIGTEYKICAPTHKAKLVLENMSGQKGCTIHQLLMLNPNLDIYELDLNDLKFLKPKIKKYKLPNIIIIDEASMINDELFGFIEETLVIEMKKKVIFLGDEKQLQPVNNNGLSKVFSLKNTIRLTKVFRQSDDSGIKDLLLSLRHEAKTDKFENISNPNGSLICFNSPKDFGMKCAVKFKDAVLSKNTNIVKIGCYTNRRVDEYNSFIRKKLFSDHTKQFYPGEFLMAYDNINADILNIYNSDIDDICINNSMDYIVTKCYENVLRLDCFNFELYGYDLYLYDYINNVYFKIFCLDNNLNSSKINFIAQYIDYIRKDALELKFKKRYVKSKERWIEYYNLMNSFTTMFDIELDNRIIKKAGFKYGYACTIHKLQGSTFDEIFIDAKDIIKCVDKDELRQLQYVGLSRTKNNVNILNI